MKIGNLQKVMSIEDDFNTRINGKLQSLFNYKHPEEKVVSVHVQDNGVVVIKTKKS